MAFSLLLVPPAGMLSGCGQRPGLIATNLPRISGGCCRAAKRLVAEASVARHSQVAAHLPQRLTGRRLARDSRRGTASEHARWRQGSGEGSGASGQLALILRVGGVARPHRFRKKRSLQGQAAAGQPAFKARGSAPSLMAEWVKPISSIRGKVRGGQGNKQAPVWCRFSTQLDQRLGSCIELYHLGVQGSSLPHLVLSS